MDTEMPESSPLRMARIARGITQHALADKAGVSQQLLSKLEKGKIRMTPERAQTFAALLGCRALDLLPSFANQPPPDGTQEVELLRIYRMLTPSQRDALMIMARSQLAVTTTDSAKAN